MTFDEWRNTDNNFCLIHSVNDSKEIWNAAWNEAIKQAAAVVRENYDEQEPWLEVSDIEELSIPL